MRVCLLWMLAAAGVSGITVQSEAVHLRSGDKREWASFPETAPHGAEISVTFQSPAVNQREYSVLVRQRDVKDTAWVVSVNGTKLGALIDDEREMVRLLAIPSGLLQAGSNTLTVSGRAAKLSDDIEVRDIRIEPLPVAELLRQATVEVEVGSSEGPLPLRVTVVDAAGSLVPVAALRTDAREAVRTGVVYTADGRTRIGLPAGEYVVYASRGFEYSAPSKRLRLRSGDTRRVTMRIKRQVWLPGFVSCDTHVHTLELSGHGDASVAERVLTAAGEGLDAIVVTEHNRLADYTPAVEKQGVGKWVRTIPGDEVTTALGHFNIFPIGPERTPPDFREPDWSKLMDSLSPSGSPRVVIQNHPRDIHLNYRPFDRSHHISSTGENRNGRPFRANAMEVVNSGAMASDPLQLVWDWLGLLTRGIAVAAIGASDTHTVDFVPVGQARTYIEESGGIVENLAAGKNLVSYGLAADVRQAGAPSGGTVPVELTVWGPSWSTAAEITVYSNGSRVWSLRLGANRKAGRKFRKVVRIPIPIHDTALVAVVTGPGTLKPFWEVRKPYQPTSLEWEPMVLGVSRALWIDSDANGRREAPLEVARALVASEPLDALVPELAKYDASVTRHAVSLLGPDRPEVAEAFGKASGEVLLSWKQFVAEWERLH